MFCSKCGGEYQENDKFCPSCGKNLINSAELSTEEKIRIEAQKKIKAKGCSGCLGFFILFIFISFIGNLIFPNDKKKDILSPSHITTKTEKLAIEKGKLAAQELVAEMLCQQAVQSSLKAPSGAVFAKDSNTKSLGHNLFKVSSYVDAQNSFGANLRSYYTCKIHLKGKGLNAKGYIKSLVFDN